MRPRSQVEDQSLDLLFPAELLDGFHHEPAGVLAEPADFDIGDARSSEGRRRNIVDLDLRPGDHKLESFGESLPLDHQGHIGVDRPLDQ